MYKENEAREKIARIVDSGLEMSNFCEVVSSGTEKEEKAMMSGVELTVVHVEIKCSLSAW